MIRLADILKRLSKPQDTVFCGRIQLFLARLFPLTEKSGLNLLSEFNLDNLTVFSCEAPPPAPPPPGTDHVELPPDRQIIPMDVDETGLSKLVVVLLELYIMYNDCY